MCIICVEKRPESDLTQVSSLLGLFGPLLVCKKGSLDSNNKQKNVNKEFVLHFVVTLEKNSWYYQDNKQLAGNPSSIDESKYNSA